MMYDVKIQIDYNFFLRISPLRLNGQSVIPFRLMKMIHDVKILIEEDYYY